MNDRIGQQLGNYRLIRQLGKGGFAVVYLGEHVHLKTLAAIKVLHQVQLSSDEEEKFRKEAYTIANLKHQHIIQILDYDIQERANSASYQSDVARCQRAFHVATLSAVPATPTKWRGSHREVEDRIRTRP